jgi:hypothetical protein
MSVGDVWGFGASEKESFRIMDAYAEAIDYGFPYDLLGSPQGQLVSGDLEPQLDLPAAAPLRWAG